MQNVTEILEGAGYLKSVAGDDFDRVCQAIEHTNSIKKVGLCLIGDVGCGKSTIVRALCPNATLIDLSDRLSHKLLEPYEEDVLVNGLSVAREDWWTIIEDNHVILDDLGNEQLKNDYGRKIDIVSEFIMRWYSESYQRPDRKARLFVTTNLTDDALITRYGERIVDRLYSMCSPVNLNNKSARKYQKRF